MQMLNLPLTGRQSRRVLDSVLVIREMEISTSTAGLSDALRGVPHNLIVRPGRDILGRGGAARVELELPSHTVTGSLRIWNLANPPYRRSDLRYRYITISKVQPSISLRAIYRRLRAPQRRLHSAARPHLPHRAQHRPQPPVRDSAAGAAAAAAEAGINGTQERVILGDKN